ncbi:MAG: VCBS repeat-containing protein [Deltaproteobacteria bacterium]|nr:VCBS repeat-containing protein [Deltaproteobacteria bacterium]
MMERLIPLVMAGMLLSGCYKSVESGDKDSDAGSSDTDADTDTGTDSYCDWQINIAPSYPTGARPNSVTTGDFNGDGILDLVAANSNSSTVSILIGNCRAQSTHTR